MKSRLLHTCLSYSWGGLEIHSVVEAEKMAERGHSVLFACCQVSRVQSEAEKRGIRTVPFSVRGYFNPGGIRRMARILREQRIDLVHCQQSKDLALVTPAVRLGRRRIPVVLSKRVGSYVMKKTFLHRFTYSSVRRVLAISEVIRRNVIDTTPVPPERVVTVHHGIDTNTFSPALADGARIRQELGFSRDHLIIGFVGRFSPGKGHEEFLEAAGQLAGSHPHVRFVIVGEASRGEESYAAGIRQRCGQEKLGDVVTFTGFRVDVRDVMASFDIFAFPSHAEAFGSVLVEAMALEKPTVASNCDGTLDIVVDGKTGLFVHPGNGRELASALERLILDPDLRRRLGEEGRRRAVREFDQTVMLDRIEKIYREVQDEAESQPPSSRG